MTAITVNAPFQVVHEGTVYGPGQTADVPEAVAQQWLGAGWVTKAEPEKRATKAPPKRAG